ncbi:MAG: PolC-type DNA polymerase III [Lachnospiraceae bacterium]|nr:PolC-type DNA polymerase III [Lachnospiraceae bacterium]
MKEKSFYEVFPNIQLDGLLGDLFKQVSVVRVSMNPGQTEMRIYLSSDRVITYRQMNTVKDIIYTKMFSGQGPKLYLLVKFHLSAQYDLPRLYDVYKESLFEEIESRDHILYDLISNAKVEFPAGDTMDITLESGVYIERKAPELEDLLTRIFTDRCGMDAKIYMHFEEKKQKDENKGWTGSWVENNTEIVSHTVPGAIPPSEDDKKADTGKAGGDKDGKEFRKDKDKRNYKIRPLRNSEDPSVIYGKDITDDAIPISDIEGEIGDCVIRGMISSVETTQIKNERTIVILTVTDFEDSIKVKLFIHNDQVLELCNNVAKGTFVKVHGKCQMDSYDHELLLGSVSGIKLIPDFRTRRWDNAPVKRVELHCHTKMSEMDGVSDCSALVKRAYEWGMPALAITDHGVVQGFTDAFHTWSDLWEKYRKSHADDPDAVTDKQDFFKVIYGVEAYIVDDLRKIANGDESKDIASSTYVVFDLETTGFSPVNDRIIEIGAVKIKDGEVIDRFSSFVNPEIPIPFRIEELTSINDNMVIDADKIDVALPKFLEFIGDNETVLVGHNVEFDVSFIREKMKTVLGLDFDYTYVDTLGIARAFLTGHKKYTLDAVAKMLNVNLDHHHRAVDDAECTALIYLKLMDIIAGNGIKDFQGLNDYAAQGTDVIKGLKTYHCIILAKNNIGRINLYRLVSESHLDYFSRFPRIPKSELNKYREGLIVGSACEAGELFSALLDRQSDEAIANIVSFYDYLEIQPVGNNRFMIVSNKYESINNEEDIRNINREIVKLGEKWNKPVVATCDVHFMDPEDEIYRRIILSGHGFDDADDSHPLFLRTTDEMLKEFDYLGEKKAYEVVVTNTRYIASMIDSMSPVRPDKCPPVIENSDTQLREICENKAHEIYGPDLPDVVNERMERELKSIIGNGFAVMYIIAQKLVWKSVEDGYLVGSRGSVGSSFVAFLAGITEVNSLSPHYYCPECHYFDFDSDEVKAFGGMAGTDMPPKICPKCGHPLNRDGYDIPFETFLGFKGDKEPDIDLNFSGEYQSKAHKYTEVIFGYGQTFRAGTIGSVASKTAYGYASHFFEEKNMVKRRCEIERIASHCEGIRKSTGQHPGGIVVLPMGEEIYTFTPVQHPANKMDTDIITTHFDYHSIDHNLLKLDILGHDDPSMMRMLQDLTELDPTTIPLDDEKVMSLFLNTEALGITPDDIPGTKLGCLGIPEFGTDNAMSMLIETKPKYMSDLIRISGLGHGTGVWGDNAQTLIREGKATISTAICCRDDIMIYLIQKGLDPAESFNIMENVRKGKVAGGKCKQWPEWKEDMIAHDVPDWYIWSCERIEYMFPKAHAAAYVIMALRIAYCKVYYPLAYYAAYFTIRASGFSYELMAMGKNRLESNLEQLRYKSNNNELSAREKDTYRDMRIAQEMYARGYEFMPIDILKVDSKRFRIIDGKIMPSLSSIEGIGPEVAETIAAAAADGPFISKAEFRERTKASKTNVEKLSDLGILSGLPESGQLSIFDFIGAAN